MSKELLSTTAAVAQLDKVAGQHEQTAATLRKLAKTLRALATWGDSLPDKPKAKGKRKRMSKAARDKIAKAARERWAAKKRANGSDDDATTAVRPSRKLQDTLTARG